MTSLREGARGSGDDVVDGEDGDDDCFGDRGDDSVEVEDHDTDDGDHASTDDSVYSA